MSIFRLILSLLLASIIGTVIFITNPTLGTKLEVNLEGSADAKLLEQIVTKISRPLPYRNAQNIARLNQTADYIFLKLRGMNLTPSWQSYEVEGETYKNIIVRLGKKTAEKQLMVIGAHYDVCEDTPGADDNASGVAGLLELARLLKLNEAKLEREVEIVFYTLEEPPYFRTEHMGSAIHAGALKINNIEIDLMLSLEMIGYFNEEDDSQDYPISLLKAIYPSHGNFIAIVGKTKDWKTTRRVKSIVKATEGVEIRSINAPSSLKGIDFSDHLNYLKLGMPALMITDTAFFRNKEYHKLGDTADRLNYTKMAQLINQILPVPFTF